MKGLILLFVFLSLNIQAKTKHPIYHRILELQPNLDKKFAMKVSNIIYTCHKENNIDKFLLVAIINQESEFINSARNCSNGLLHEESINKIIDLISRHVYGKDMSYLTNWLNEGVRDDLSNLMIKNCADFGLGQINIKTPDRYPKCNDLIRLKIDYKYNLECACSILSGLKKKYASDEFDWWTRYNSPTREKRDVYRKLVNRWR